MKIAIVGASGYGNVGDDAYRELLQHYLTHHECRFFNSDLPARFPADFDAIIFGGGGLIYCSTNPHLVSHFSYMQWYMDEAIRQKIPWGFLSCGIQVARLGNGYDWKSLIPWKPCLQRADFLTVRSETDAAILGQLTGRNDIRFFPDLCYLAGEAWGRPSANADKYVLLIPTSFHDVRSRAVSESIAKAEDAGCALVICNFGAERDDLPAIDRCRKALPRARVVLNPTPRDAFHLVCGAKWVVSGRYHGIIFARAAGVPCCAPANGPYKIREDPSHVSFQEARQHLEILRKLESSSPKLRLPRETTLGHAQPGCFPFYRPETSFGGAIETVLDDATDNRNDFDEPLAEKLSELLQGFSVLNLGHGRYAAHFRNRGIACLEIRDPAVPLELGCRFHWGLSLEVGEHVPREHQEVFLDHLVCYSTRGIVLSWAAPGQGGRGHVNEQPNPAIRRLMRERNFLSDLHLEHQLRQAATFPWFSKTLMVFRPAESRR